MKTATLAGRHDLATPASIYAANCHEVTLLQEGFELYMSEAKPENLNGDRRVTLDPEM